MWGHTKSPASATAKLEPRALHANPSRLGGSLHVKGEISGTDALLIEGSVEGLIHLESQKVILSPACKVNADVVAGEVIVLGKLTGNVRASCGIAIGQEGSVTGNLMTPEILIEDGAFFKGSIEIDKQAEKESSQIPLPSSEPVRKSVAHA